MKELADIIVSKGIKHVFGIPGSGKIYSLLYQLKKQGVDVVVTKHEASAAIMASISYKAVGIIGISYSIKGPGFLNSLPGIGLSFFEEFPHVHLVEGYNVGEMPLKAHKKLSQFNMAKHVSKGYYSNELSKDDLTKIFEIPTTSPKGVIFIELSDTQSLNFPINFVKSDKKHFDISLLNSGTSKKVLILGYSFFQNHPEFNIDDIKIPFFITLRAIGGRKVSNPYFMGTFTGNGKSLTIENYCVNSNYVFLFVGVSQKELLGNSWENNEQYAFESFEDVSVFQNIYSVDKPLLNFLTEARLARPELNTLLNKKNALTENLISLYTPAKIFDFIQRQAVNTMNYVMDTGNFCTPMELLAPNFNEGNYFFAHNSKYMGTSIPMSIGLSILVPNKPVVCFVGDGGVGMHIGELTLVEERKLPILFILLINEGFESINNNIDVKMLSVLSFDNFKIDWSSVFNGFGIKSSIVLDETTFIKEWISWDKRSPKMIQCNFSADVYSQMLINIR